MQKPNKSQQSHALSTQIIHELRERILTGELTVGTRIPTESEIAQQHQISRGTVRQALGILVNEGLLERIQGSGTFVRQSSLTGRYKAPQSAQKSIGLILNQDDDELNMAILLGVEQATKPRGYQLSFAYSHNNTQQLALDIARLRTSTSGFIIFPISNTPHDAAIEQLKANSFPFVLVDRYIPELECDYVGSDNIGGGYRVTEHLCILGHTRIGFVYSRTNGLFTTSVRDRFEGYRKALKEYNVPYDDSLVLRDAPDSAGEEANAYDAFLTHPNRPSAVFATNDAIALELFKAAHRCSLRVPENLALVGFDDVSYAALLDPPLTTVTQQRTELGIRAGNLLLNRIEDQSGGGAYHIELPTTLVVRQSCGARLRVSSAVMDAL